MASPSLLGIFHTWAVHRTFGVSSDHSYAFYCTEICGQRVLPVQLGISSNYTNDLPAWSGHEVTVGQSWILTLSLSYLLLPDQQDPILHKGMFLSVDQRSSIPFN